MSAHKKLMEARLKLQSMELKKSGQNKFAGYQYFELGDFLPTIQNIFSELKLCGVVSFTSDLATLTITDIEDASSIVITSPMGSAALKGCHEVQNVGAVETYQRRYLWVAALEIVEHDVLDAVTGSDSGKPTAKTRGTITPTTGAGEGLTSDEKNVVQIIAGNVQAYLKSNQEYEAYEAMQGAELDADKKVYFWTFFNSKERSTLKSIHESIHGKAA